MAGIKTFEAPGCRISLCADKAYGVEKRYIPVKMATVDGVFTEATSPDTDNIIGVLQNEVKAGEAGQVAVSGVTYFKSANALIAGDTIGNWGTVIVGCAAGGIASVLIQALSGTAESITFPTASSPADSKNYWGTLVSAMQSGITVANNAITGTLKYLSSGSLVNTWGAGNFLALKFETADWSAYDSVKVGMNPSASSGLVELDQDHDGVFKVTDKNTQKFVVHATKGNTTKTLSFDLSGLTCETA